MDHQQDVIIETTDQLAEWLLKERPVSACLIAPHVNGKMFHFIIVNGGKGLVPALVGAWDIIPEAVARLDPSYGQSGKPKASSRAERRRRKAN